MNPLAWSNGVVTILSMTLLIVAAISTRNGSMPRRRGIILLVLSGSLVLVTFVLLIASLVTDPL